MRIRRRTALMVAGIAVAGGVALAPAAQADEPVGPMIVGGRDATEQYPWMTSIQNPHPDTGKLIHMCGGELVHRDRVTSWVLTAAHCASIFQTGLTRVRVGAYNWTEGGTAATVTEIHTHPGWEWQPGNDVALLRIDRRVPQRPITVAREPGATGMATRVLGWGTMCEVTDPRFPCYPLGLQEADTALATDADCAWYDGSVELCTRGADGNAMACFGDSGGPQIRRLHGQWHLIGVTSRDGDADANTNPACSAGTGVWTDVTKYRTWMRHVIFGAVGSGFEI